METMRDIQIRMKSIESTRQITETMRLISNRKVQKIKKRMEDNRPYYERAVKIIGDAALGARQNPDIRDHAYMAGHGSETKKPLVIVVTADRGLCGGYNSNALKEAAALMKNFGEATVFAIGTKGRDYFKRRKINIGAYYKGMSENPFFEDAQSISGAAVKMFAERDADAVYLVYTEYNTMLSQTPASVRLLPLDTGGADVGGGGDCDPGEAEFFEYAVSAYVTARLFGGMLSSAVSEQCARLTGMDSAVKNSEKIIDSLKLRYNQMRQGAITQEIAEIVGGANAVGK